MKRILKVFLILTLAFLFISGTTLRAAETLKIGAVLPLTGNNANTGEDARDGLKMAEEEWKGKTPFDLKVIYEDDQMTPALTNSAALKLAQVDHVDAMFSVWTPAANIISPHTDRTKIIHISAAWDKDPVDKFHYTLVYGPGIETFAKRCVEVMKMHHAKRVVIAAIVQAGNQKILQDIAPLMKAAGIEIVFKEQFPPGVRDFRTYVLKIRETHPDFILSLTFSPEDEIFWKDYKTLCPALPSTGYYDEASTGIRTFVDGAIFPATMATDAFNQKFQARFGHTAKFVEAGEMYDMLNMTIKTANELYKKLGRMPTHQELLAELKTPRQLENVSVGSATVHPDGWIESNMVLHQIKDGKIINYAPGK